ncbi:MAG: arsenate reductase ArsC [Chloroflexi bacterium]|nr:arsenate reductase ArsC [Chloroflexota bacterium]
MAERRRVLFLCTGNSCRSQMAEAVVNARMGDRWQAFSAGVEPAAQVNPKTIQALAEVGIRHSGEAKHVDGFINDNFDLVVTVCDDAAENCPVWLGRGRKTHLSFPDPAKARGTDEEVMDQYRKTLRDVAEKIPALLVSKEKE